MAESRKNEWTVGKIMTYIITVVLVSFLFMPREYVISQTVSENKSVIAMLDEETYSRIENVAESIYENVITNNGISETLTKGKFTKSLVGRDNTTETVEQYLDLVDDYLNSRGELFLDWIWWSMTRLLVFGMWIIYSSPIAIAAVYHGFIKREILVFTNGYSSPSKASLCLKGFGVMMFMLFITLTVPIAIPAEFLPIVMVTAVALNSVVLANLPWRM